ncbi:MAG: thioredoxin domain-containing protein, partial [Actinomycetota bacterium]
RVTRETAEFLLRDLHTPEGGFASSLDADTVVEDGTSVEGATYVWTPAELRTVLGDEDGRWAADLLGVTDAGTFERGTSTLQRRRDPDDPERWARVRERLLRTRVTRPQPDRDDKVVAAWNGLAISALADAGAVLGEQSWIDAAIAAADLIVRLHLDDRGRLRRVSRAGEAGEHPGILEDYANVAQGFLSLVAATGDPVWLSFAEQLLEVVLRRHTDADGSMFDTGDDTTDARLIRRPQDPTDNATPSGQSAAAGALLTFAAYTGSARHREAAERALGIYDALADQAPRFTGWGLAVAEALLAGPAEVAIVGPVTDPRTGALRDVAVRSTAPGAAVVVGDPSDPAVADVPLLRDRPMVGGAPAAYVCRGFVCRAPVTAPDELAAELAA